MQANRYFIDTNLIVYCFDDESPTKQTLARDLVGEALESGTGIISFQVIQEFINVATRRFATRIKPDDLQEFLSSVMYLLWEVYPSKDLYDEAIYVQHRYQLSFYDSLIVAAALSAGCTKLYSEDLRHGQKIRNMTILNPFVDFTDG